MTNMKRGLSDVDSESDGDFDDYKDGSPSQSCGPPSDRKKRRGIIEKRRRDRINNSLAELRRLVPTAFEKQGSAKLEKAEILQMTVDHLKLLHQKGLNGYNIDPTTLAMDYRSVGFRECAAEVARYLVTVEGLDIQDPLRLRLMSHLQCFSAQREAASKHTLQGPLSTGSWNGHAQYSNSSLPPPSMISQHHSQDQLPGYPSTMTHSHTSALGAGCGDGAMSRIPPPPPPPPHGASTDSATSHMNAHIRLPTAASVAPSMPSSVSTASSPQVSAPMLHSQFPSVHTQFPMSLSVNSMPMLSPSGSHNYSTSTTSAISQSSSGMGMAMSSMKPYRPWGAELAY